VGNGQPSIDDLLDRAVAAINRGDRLAATELTEHVLSVDARNAEAEDLLGAPAPDGEIRRLGFAANSTSPHRVSRLQSQV
jgi:hypothetical protein